MYKRTIILAVAVAFLAACGSGGKTLVTVNGKKITEGDLDFLSKMNPRLKMQLATPFGKKQILENLIEQELLYQAALKRGLQRDSDVKAKIELYKKVLIAQSYIEDDMKRKALEYYEKNKPEFEKLQLSDILIKFAPPPSKDKKAPHPPKDKVTRSKDAALKLANEVKAKIDGGMEFAAAAKEFSDDPVSKNAGGDVGKVSKNDPRVERKGYGPLLEKAFSMKVGETAGPIETSDGFHIITITKGIEQQPFEEAEQAIMFKIQGEEKNKLLTELKGNSKIVYADEGKKEEAVQQPAPGSGPDTGAPSAQPSPPPTKIELKPTPEKAAPPAKPAEPKK